MFYTLFAELTKIEEPGEYKKDSWALDEQEKQDAIPRLKAEGNALFKEKEYSLACEKYAEALGHIEHLVLRYIFLHVHAL